MRYPQGGGLTAERQAFREHIRLQAAELFAAGQGNAAVARELRVSVRSVQRWRRTWDDGGEQALASKGPASRPKLSEALFAVLEQGAGQGTGGARLAGPDMDAVADQDADRAPVPHEHDVVGDRADAAPARLQPPGPGQTRGGTRPGSCHRLDEGHLAPGGNTAAALGA